MFDKLIGATLRFPFDYAQMGEEILSCRSAWKPARARAFQVIDGLAGTLPFRSESIENYKRLPYVEEGMEPVQGTIGSPHRFYLRRNPRTWSDDQFATMKAAPHSDFMWVPEAMERCSYTRNCIASLPFKSVGVVFAFVLENSFLPTHRDYAWSTELDGEYDKSKSLGLSLIPETGGIGTQIWHPGDEKVYQINGNATLFDDAMWHGTKIPAGGSRRIIIRVFGEMDWEQLENYIVKNTIISL
jgi:hypothetical protein